MQRRVSPTPIRWRLPVAGMAQAHLVSVAFVPPNAKLRLTPSTSGGANPSAHGDRRRGSKMGLCQTSRRTTYLFREQLDSTTVQYLELHGIS